MEEDFVRTRSATGNEAGMNGVGDSKDLLAIWNIYSENFNNLLLLMKCWLL